ncbi:hypothetical protein OG757_41110 [Streptomyces sp. NBC_01262]|nr:hypothetical protein [Streptomyces sp. NBC_01262]
MPALHALALNAYDRMIGPDLGEISVNGCIRSRPAGAGPSSARIRG